MGQFPDINILSNTFIKGELRILEFYAESRVFTMHCYNYTRVEPERNKLMETRMVARFYIGNLASLSRSKLL